MIRSYVLGFIVWLFYKTLSATWKVTVEEPESMTAFIKNKDPLILAHWHGDEVALISQVNRYKIATITSTSKDGEMMDLVIRLLGAKTSRGSSTRGGVGALKGIIKLAKEGHNTSFAVDGPKGPLHKVKPGVFELSRLMAGTIFVAGVSCDRKWVFEKAWNKAYLPKPFAKIHIVWRGPIGPITKGTDPRDENLAKTLEDALHNVHSIALKKMDAPTHNS